ncbi:hypothetical protein OBK28_12075 [Empedobacter falsenii]
MAKEQSNNRFYLKAYKDIYQTFKNTKSWNDAFLYVMKESNIESKEAFIDNIEEVYKTKVKDENHLVELIGLKSIGLYDQKKEKFISPKDSEQGEYNLKSQSWYILNSSRFSKYYRTILNKIETGSKYNDLLNINPFDFDLDEEWNFGASKNKYTTITTAIYQYFLLGEPAGLTILPSLRNIANDLDAPYSVLIDSYNTYR